MEVLSTWNFDSAVWPVLDSPLQSKQQYPVCSDTLQFPAACATVVLLWNQTTHRPSLPLHICELLAPMTLWRVHQSSSHGQLVVGTFRGNLTGFSNHGLSKFPHFYWFQCGNLSVCLMTVKSLWAKPKEHISVFSKREIFLRTIFFTVTVEFLPPCCTSHFRSCICSLSQR